MIARALRHYMLQQREIRQYTSNHVYVKRIPQGEHPVIAIVITTQSVRRFYDLLGEDGFVQTTLDLEFIGKIGVSDYKMSQAFEAVRKKISAYRGNMGQEHEQIWVNAILIVRDFMEEPVFLRAENRWTNTYSVGIEISHAQDSVATPA